MPNIKYFYLKIKIFKYKYHLDLDKFIQKRKQKNEKIETIDILVWLRQILQGIDY